MIHIQHAIPRMQEFCFKAPVDWELSSDEHWTIIGPNGSGKSIFADILNGKIVLKSGSIHSDGIHNVQGAVKLMTFKTIYDTADYPNMYYQQRWNSTETEESPWVRDLVRGDHEKEYLKKMLWVFNAEDIWNKRLIFLSGGELRKFFIIKALANKPKVLILDNPYIGLDISSRQHLNELLEGISAMKELQIILILSNPNDIPEMITHILPIQEMGLKSILIRNEFLDNSSFIKDLFPEDEKEITIPKEEASAPSYKYALKMENINIKYGNRTILKDLSWEVKQGEKWALLGPNGSGKSTLLSLVCADNPQSYANTFYLFDRKRGSGESIWDIKKRIGYISPEIHLYYLEEISVLNVVGSGFFDSIGLYRKCNEKQQSKSLEWMKVFGIDHLKDRSFMKISYGEQRLVLLARAFVKHPELLILDEPLHGLDKSKKAKVSKIIEKFCQLPGKTLIYVTHYQEEIPPCVTSQFTLSKQS